MYSFKKQRVAVIGSAGQVGTPLTKGLLSLGHEVVVLIRRRSANTEAKLAEYEAAGAQIVEVTDMQNVALLADALAGVDTLICAVPGSKEIIANAQPVWLDAAVKAGVKRFVPTEFGCHTRALAMGEGEVFDNKKRFHEKLFKADIGWTLFYNGGIFDYFLPNLRFFRKITTFGDMALPIYTHHIDDIGYVAALALTDERTLNKCVQMDFSALNQTEMLGLLKANYPEHDFEFEHFSGEYITEALLTAGDEVTAKKGGETDKERWGINYVIYVLGKLAMFTDETLRTSALYPDYQLSMTPAQAIADHDFVFEK